MSKITTREKGTGKSVLNVLEQRNPKAQPFDPAIIQQVVTTWLTTQLNTPHK